MTRRLERPQPRPVPALARGLLALSLLAAAGCGADPAPAADAGLERDAAVGEDAEVGDGAPPLRPAIARFEASASTVAPGARVSLQYAVTDAAQVWLTAERGDGVVPLLTGSPTLSGRVESPPLDETTVFRLRATGGGESVEATATVQVVAPQVEILRFTAPALVDRGGTALVEWTVTGATEVRLLDHGATLARVTDGSPSGAVELVVLQGPRALVLEATNGVQARSAALEIRTLDPGEILDFHVSPSVIRNSPTPARVSWRARGASVRVLANGVPLAGVPPEALTSSVALTVSEPTVFTLEATGLGRAALARRAVVPGALLERQPNDALQSAAPGAPGVLGRIDAPGDVDFYHLSVPEGGNVYAELSDRYGRCPFDGGLRLLDPTGRELLEVDNGEREPCARVDPALDLAARGLPAGTYYLAVDGRDPGAYYGLAVILGEARCGNGIVEASRGEACDDGNLSAGDGCTAACALELLDAIHLPGPPVALEGALVAPGVVDYYALEVATPVAVALETGVPTPGVCDARAGYADTYLELIDAALHTIAWSDDHLGLCAGLVPATPADLPAGTYYVAVRAYGAGVIPAYTLSVRAYAAVCGDGALAPEEACDDGNLADGDGCSAVCTVERLLPPGGAVELALRPGAVRAVDVEVTLPGQSLTATTSNGRGGCDVDTRLVLARDGAYLGYATGGPGCARLSGRTHPFAANLEPGTYRLLVYDEGASAGTVRLEVAVEDPRCGNGLAETRAGEQCDDGNQVDGDGCGADCQRQVSGTAHGPGGPREVFTGALSGGGDEQLWGVELSAPGHLYAELGLPALGRCEAGDPVLELYDLAMQPITANDDANGLCSRIDPSLDPAARLDAGTYLLLVRSFDRSSPIPSYELGVTLLTVGCGNGVVDAGESCDDGNTGDGDGCSSLCAYEGALTETEPNDDLSVALALPWTPGRPTLVAGATQPAGDEDWYALTIPLGQTVSLRAETRTDPLDPLACANADTWLSLYDGAGNVLAEDDDDGEGTCSRIDGTGAAPADPNAADLTAGTYYLKHRPYASSQTIPVYFLEVTLQ